MLFQALLSGSIKAITGGSIRAIIDKRSKGKEERSPKQK